jgi:phage terminase large subunit
MTVEGFCGSEAPTYPDRKYKQDRKNGDLFRNKRAQWWWYLRDRFEATYRAIEHGEYLNPDDLISLSSDMPRLKLLKAELTRVQRKRGRSVSSLIQIESKQDMKSRALKSPNLADALVYSFANKGLSVTMAKPINYPRRVM